MLTFSTILYGNEFIIVEKNGRFGLKNSSTKTWTIEPIYESLGWSNGQGSIINNLIGARLNEKWALLTIDGTKVTQHLFVSLVPYRNELFIASNYVWDWKENSTPHLYFGR